MVYRASTLRGLAITQMIIGALMVIFGVASVLAVDHWSSYAAYGIWIGVWVIITGVLGYNGAKDNSVPHKCLIGCFMGFAITSCVLAAIMFISYCVALSQFSSRLRCSYDYYSTYRYRSNDCYDVYDMSRETARNGAGFGSCLLLFALVEFFVALASSISCCNAVCCSSQAPQVTFVPAQPMGQSGVVVVQPTGQVTSLQTVYPVAVQQPMYMPQQPMQQIPPGYWPPAGAVPVSYSVVGTPQTQLPAQQPYKHSDVPPPYSNPMNTAVPPVASDAAAPPSYF